MTAYSRVFSDLYDDVIARARMDATDDLAKTKEWINQTLAELAVRSKFFTGAVAGSALSAGATSQALPASVIDLDYITSSFGGEIPRLREVPFSMLLDARGFNATAGPPLRYALRQNTVEFWPVAAGGEVFTYYGAILPDELSGASDTIPLPEPYPDVLVYGALVKAGEFKRDPLLPQWQAQYQYELQRFLSFVNARGGSGPYRFDVRGPGMARLPFHPSTDATWWP